MSFYQSAFDFSRLKASYSQGRERGALLAFARVAERADRYEDVTRALRELIRTIYTSASPPAPAQSGYSSAAADPYDLTDEERAVLVHGYKHVIGNIRSAWRGIRNEEGGQYADLLTDYRASLEAQLQAICVDTIALLEQTLCKAVAKPESKVFYTKFVGDLYRYLAEIGAGGSPEKKAAEYYQAASRLASASLEPTHPTRLGLSLNFSVCLFEILKDKKQACELAKTAFDQAIAKLDDLEEASYKDSTLLMQLLRDNLTLWMQDSEQ